MQEKGEWELLPCIGSKIKALIALKKSVSQDQHADPALLRIFDLGHDALCYAIVDGTLFPPVGTTSKISERVPRPIGPLSLEEDAKLVRNVQKMRDKRVVDKKVREATTAAAAASLQNIPFAEFYKTQQPQSPAIAAAVAPSA
jgi:hypothetical protein